MPHWQIGGSLYFITFRSKLGVLSEEALALVKHHILFDHRRKYELFFGVVMPDHVHVMLSPLEKEKGSWFSLAEIIKGIKGSSARSINKLLSRTGTVWQEDYFDRIVRDEKEMIEKYTYMWNNPLKANLVSSVEKYLYYIRPDEK